MARSFNEEAKGVSLGLNHEASGTCCAAGSQRWVEVGVRLDDTSMSSIKRNFVCMKY